MTQIFADEKGIAVNLRHLRINPSGTLTGKSNPAPSVLRRKNDLFFVAPSRAADPVAGVEKRDEQHETDEQHGETALDVIENSGTDRTPAGGLDE
jgi:hypothetical protein